MRRLRGGVKNQRQSGFLIGKIHLLGDRILARKLRHHNVEINPAQGRIMFVLWRQDGIPISELARQAGLEKSTLTSMLDRLEQMGYLRRVRSPHDRRQVLIQRTEQDLGWQDVYIEVSQEMSRLFYRGFSEEEIERLENYLERLYENLSAEDTEQ
ncbi:MAG: MarR family transcriptional regulator [Chloroflexota bacterium]